MNPQLTGIAQQSLIDADGHDSLTTHTFDPDDSYINSDAVFGVKENLMASFDWITDADLIAKEGMPGAFFFVNHDFVLAPLKA